MPPRWLGAQLLSSAKPLTQPVVSTQPGYPFFKQPASIPISTPPKRSVKLHIPTAPLAERIQHISGGYPVPIRPSVAPSVIIKDVIGDDDEGSVPDRSRSSNVKSTHGSSNNGVTSCEEGMDRIL